MSRLWKQTSVYITNALRKTFIMFWLFNLVPVGYYREWQHSQFQKHFQNRKRALANSWVFSHMCRNGGGYHVWMIMFFMLCLMLVSLLLANSHTWSQTEVPDPLDRYQSSEWHSSGWMDDGGSGLQEQLTWRNQPGRHGIRTAVAKFRALFVELGSSRKCCCKVPTVWKLGAGKYQCVS